jgi:chromosome segregation ATPase
MREQEMKDLKGQWIALLIIGGLIITASASISRIKAETNRGVWQDPISLERRMSALEQRLYSIESSINRLEQRAALDETRTLAGQRTERDPELDLLQRRIEALQGQLNEIECGLAKLDERTLVTSVREARKRSGQLTIDPCRLNPDAPLEISVHP